MSFLSKAKAAVQAVKAEAVVAKAAYDMKVAGYDPNDYAGFNGEGRTAPKEDRNGVTK